MALPRRSQGKDYPISGAGVGAVLIVSVIVLAAAFPACAADYVSVAENAAVLYDAPSLKAKKMFVVSRYLPLEKVVSLDNWVKVRDSSGSLAWVEKRALSNKHYVMVTVPLAAVHMASDEQAVVVARARQGVALEWLENTGTGWLKVRHQDGTTGYLRTTEAWGD